MRSEDESSFSRLQRYGQSEGQSRQLSRGHSERHSHGSALFNPYGLSHERGSGPQDLAQSNLQGARQGLPPPFASYPEQPYNSAGPAQLPAPWDNADQFLEDFFTVRCACGDACSCPGCVQHRGFSVLSEQTPPAHSCANPASCMACQNYSLDSSIYAQQGDAGPVLDPATLAGVEDWLQSLGGGDAGFSRSPPGGVGSPGANTGVLPQFMNMGITSGNASPYGTLPPQFNFGDERCRCPPGQCKCSEGSSDYVRDDGFNALSYANSGERASARYPGQPSSGGVGAFERFTNAPPPLPGMARMPSNVGPGTSASHAAMASFMSQPNSNLRRSASSGSQSSGRSSESVSEASGAAAVSNTMRIANQAGFRPSMPNSQSSFSSSSSRRR